MTERFIYADTDVAFEPGDSILVALQRAGIHPTDGGTLCCGGDCPHCVATVDGISYLRTCQTPAAAGLVVEPHPPSGEPPLPERVEPHPDVPILRRHVHTVVIGGGGSGQAAAAERRDAVVFDAGRGEEVVGIYPGPLVMVRTAMGMVHVECEEVVVATGAAELHPVCPGSDLRGLLTSRAAGQLVSAGLELGRVVIVGDGESEVEARRATGRLIRFEGTGTVEAVVTTDGRWECDSVVVALGLVPRDALARMGAGMPVTVVGDAATSPELPPCPTDGVVCPCGDVTVAQLDDVWQRGFTEMELLKRATLAGTGTCQGGACTPYLRSFLLDRGAELQPAFTARPVARQLTMAEMAAGSHLPAYPRTALHDVHLTIGARMDRIGGWWRPWTYGDTDAEYEAVRHRVSIGDVSTLGKMRVTGPDAEAMLQRIYPTDVSTIRPGRSRYVLLLNERGYVFDDGLVCREPDGTFTLTFTSGGASGAEMWIRDWAASWGHDVRLLNQTLMLGAINVSGPLTHELLAAVGAADLPPYMGHGYVDVAGVPCKVFRLSFTGELSYELHHPVDRSVELWEALMAAGAPLGIVPHGLEALTRLRLDKGHILVGQDTDYDSTPRRIHHEWAVNLDKGDFIGRLAVVRTNAVPLDRQLVGFTLADGAPPEGAVIWHGGSYAGYVTSAAWSPAVGMGVAMGWLDVTDGVLPDDVTIEGWPARRVTLPFYDPEGSRARA